MNPLLNAEESKLFPFITKDKRKGFSVWWLGTTTSSMSIDTVILFSRLQPTHWSNKPEELHGLSTLWGQTQEIIRLSRISLGNDWVSIPNKSLSWEIDQNLHSKAGEIGTMKKELHSIKDYHIQVCCQQYSSWNAKDVFMQTRCTTPPTNFLSVGDFGWVWVS